MREVIKNGKSIDEAIEQALEELHATLDQVTIDVLEEPKRGLLGIGAKPAIVKVILKENPIEKAINYLRDIVEKMGVIVEIKATQHDERNVECQLTGDDLALLIGKRGHTLNALQYLTNLVANKHSDHKLKIVLDAENYRARRKESLEILAERMAHKAVRNRRKVKLDPMPAYERKIVHTVLQPNRHIKTASEGEEPHRYVTISPES
ncbi:spoIIIJ-associated protein [Scopulibacillus darangshiensis]|uniref:RNA-binding protein KhpB n=1 Tax=Scopulibacillus darangshiensis TaxID=442528 RepID=A0A4R2NFR5_9BACL|nr:RNA-binding cell elongation regulator Jag/EloR [Scopulibacillus darangshiensis]TCP20012.1 spoIIIJ-associated protein [Scopulibacillus darangshiensis]